MHRVLQVLVSISKVSLSELRLRAIVAVRGVKLWTKPQLTSKLERKRQLLRYKLAL